MKLSPKHIAAMQATGRMTVADGPLDIETRIQRDVAKVIAVAPSAPRTNELSFFVHGVPRPKGSMNSFVNPWTKKIVSLFGSKESRPRLACWAACIKAEASVAAKKKPSWFTYGNPVKVYATFFMPRPKSHYGKNGLKETAPEYSAKRPDLDKLLRTLLDALTGIAWHDDAQVAVVHATKQYGNGDVGCKVAVRVIERSKGHVRRRRLLEARKEKAAVE